MTNTQSWPYLPITKKPHHKHAKLEPSHHTPQPHHSMHGARIRWACRRGMLELDLLLIPFFDHHFTNLSAVERVHFEHLLQHTDPELYEWLLGQSLPEDSSLMDIVKKIRGSCSLHF